MENLVQKDNFSLESCVFSKDIIDKGLIINEILYEQSCSLEYGEELEKYVTERLSTSLFEADDEEVSRLIMEFEMKYYEEMFGEECLKLNDFKKSINNPNLTENEVVKLFEMLSEGSVLSSEDIVQGVNSAVPSKLVKEK